MHREPLNRDADIVRLNSLGYGLSQIAKKLHCHPTTITSRLTKLGIEPADTRRTFITDIYDSMTPAQLDWLTNQLGPGITIKDYIRNLLVTEFIQQTTAKAA